MISVVSKYKDNETHNQIINDYLTEYDCKLQFYYFKIEILLLCLNKIITFPKITNIIFLLIN